MEAQSSSLMSSTQRQQSSKKSLISPNIIVSQEEEAPELEEERGILPDVSSILALHPHRAISSQETWSRTLRQWVASTDNLLVRAVALLQLAGTVAHCHANGLAAPHLKASAVGVIRVLRSPLPALRLPASSLRAMSHGMLTPEVGKQSPYYAPPEFFSSRPYDGVKADIWVLGVVFFLVMTRSYPFLGASTQALKQAICTQHPVFPHHISPDIRGLILAMLNKNAAARPSLTEVLVICLRALQPLFNSPTQETLPRITDPNRSCAAGVKHPRDEAI